MDTEMRDQMILDRVHELMRDGYGYEDIAVRLKIPLNVVRLEAKILRGEGELIEMYRPLKRLDDCDFRRRMQTQ